MIQAQQDWALSARMIADAAVSWLQGHGGPDAAGPAWRRIGAAMELIARSGTSHRRPEFGLSTTRIGNAEIAVTERVVHAGPFGSLLHFAKDTDRVQPRLLVVAPMSGHFATLLRATVRTLLPENDVFITDWHNARDVGLHEGGFDLDDFIAHIIQFLGLLGPGSHVLAVCQPTVPVLAAVALMAQDNHPDQPRSMTLMAGPIDTRLNPTKVNALAQSRSIDWFERNLIGTVPLRFAGRMRRVYPGHVQLAAFMAMNLPRHIKAHEEQYRSLVEGDAGRAAAHRAFYDEYFAVMDLPAEFYLQTIRTIFQEHALPLGRMRWRGSPVEPRAIRRTALLTVEGEHDDICAIGQTMAALDLCEGLRPSMRRHHLQTGVGHYGVFSGRRWTGEIYPKLRETIQAYEA